MARALWSGSISFGLVNVPVQLVSAARDLDLHFHQLHDEDRRRLEQRRFCKKEDEEVGWEEVGRGYDLAGKQVVLSDEELGAAEPRKTRTIDIDSFAPLATIDPIYFDHPYYLGPDRGAEKAYALLVAAMSESKKVAIARFVLRNKENLAALRPINGVMTMATMRFADEVVDTAEVAETVEDEAGEPSAKELKMARELIDSLAAEFDPRQYRDEYREELLELIERKAAGKSVVATGSEAPQPTKAPDLMAALEESLAAVRDEDRKAPKRKPRKTTAKSRSRSKAKASK